MSERSASISLRQLAAAAGVSVGTASQALRGTGTTSCKTADRIRRLAEELGYSPDPLMAAAGSRHRAGRTGANSIPVGFLCAAPRLQLERYPTIRFQSECEELLRREGYLVSTAIVETRDALRHQLREWYYRGFRGLLLSHFWHPAWIRELDWSAFSVIHLGGRVAHPVFARVQFSAAQGLDRCLAEALNRPGRIGVVLHYHDEQRVMDDVLREGVLADHCRRSPDRFCKPLKLAFSSSWEAQLKSWRAWWRVAQPDCVVGFPVARHLLHAARSKGGQVPRFHQYSGDLLRAEEAGIVEPPKLLVETSVKLLEDMIRRRDHGIPEHPLSISIPPLWMEALSQRDATGEKRSIDSN